MLHQIFTNTPKWVFALFFVLIAIGFRQAVARRISQRRVVLLPIAMVGLSLFGTVSAFGSNAQAFTVWFFMACCLAFLILNLPMPEGVAYEASTQQFNVPGSWIPMALLMGIFLSKYLVGASTAMHPELLNNDYFILGFSSLNGTFSGVFLGRAIRLVRFAHRPV